MEPVPVQTSLDKPKPRRLSLVPALPTPVRVKSVSQSAAGTRLLTTSVPFSMLHISRGRIFPPERWWPWRPDVCQDKTRSGQVRSAIAAAATLSATLSERLTLID